MTRKRLELVPEGWPCTLADCPVGPFAFLDGDAVGAVGWMTNYGREMKDGTHVRSAYNEAGEHVSAECHGESVQPLAVSWDEEGE